MQKSTSQQSTLFNSFLGQTVTVRTQDGTTVKGMLVGVEHSNHGDFGNLLLLDQNRFILIRGSLIVVVIKPL